MNNTQLEHVCETCGRTEVLTSDEAYESGWDYPPRIGSWGVISPRTCGQCGIWTTLWWALAAEKKEVEDLTPQHRQTLLRILTEAQPDGAA